jgi:hypothetical protein
MNLIRQYRRKTLTPAVLVALVVLSTVFIGLSYADSKGINFESPAYTTGSINGQNGWSGQNPPGLPINPGIDQAIVTNGSGAPASFGAQSWRLSNFYTSGSFGDMPFSPSLTDEAGETLAQNSNGVFQMSGGARRNHFEAQFSFASADPTGATDNDSYFSTSADRGDGARMSYIRIEDRPSGMDVFFDDYADAAPFGTLATPANGCGAEDDFTEVQVASGLSRAAAHSVKVTIDFVDGPRNDVVKVYIDGTLVHTGTTWEDYFRWCTESGGGVPNDAAADQSRTVDSLLFRVGGADGFNHPANFEKGFLIDGLSYLSSRPPGSANQCKNGGWQSLTRADGSTFKNQGDCMQYVNTGK